jgi:CrcB protein
MTLLGITLLAIGGAVGTLARYALTELSRVIVPQEPAPAFPWGTLAVNLLGCFVIGVLATILAPSSRDDLRNAVLVGVLGGFTTFSSFAWETQALWAAGRAAPALAYIVTSVFFGIALAMLGKRLAS